MFELYCSIFSFLCSAINLKLLQINYIFVDNIHFAEVKKKCHLISKIIILLEMPEGAWYVI